ncbi:DJ-1 family protein [Campylobacter blaseri]|uniref:DJ-1 family protein n=1 Tax=Campylobacter blaseri TaxID=2042961 RepID=A0A2P8R0P5_9BACT|nr:DJ-1 family glyoxalase III [Campylobacter blaseri]PSM52075.1 DJ-1 family protein [Campylobacter blaseri]PSM53860.1 DJ-1 family protein [Campylobacter blaseri]QKF85584.1 DJ-1 family protein [Campylobacter blaseri]
MKKVAVMFADGFEEIEAMSVVDILRRAGLETLSVGLFKKIVTGAHNVEMKTDSILDDLNVDEFDMIVLPGGLPGAEHLAKSEKLAQILKEFDRKNLKIAAICAAPWALSEAGVLKEKYTCYPGFEKQVNHKGYIADKNVVIDKNIITSKGPATAMEFALALVKELLGESRYKEVKEGLLFS